MISGDGDICAIGVPTTLSAIINGAEIASIASWQPVVDYQIVGKKGVVGSLADLPGKTLSSAAPKGLTTEFPKMVLKKHGMDPNAVKFLQVGGHGDRLKAVVAGKTQAAMINTLTATIGVLQGEVEILTALAKEFPGAGYVLLVVNRSALEDADKRKALEIFVEGSIHGARFIMDDPEGAARLLNARNPDLDLDLITSVVKSLNDIGVWGVNGGGSARGRRVHRQRLGRVGDGRSRGERRRGARSVDSGRGDRQDRNGGRRFLGRDSRQVALQPPANAGARAEMPSKRRQNRWSGEKRRGRARPAVHPARVTNQGAYLPC